MEVVIGKSDAPEFGRLSARELGLRFLNALQGSVISHSAVDRKPLEVDLEPPLPARIRVYLFNATHPPGGRTAGEHKIQLAVPGQGRDETASFDYSDGRIVILCGVEPELNVFILWDPANYPFFSFSRNVQVRAQTVYTAFAGELGEQLRSIRGGGDEIVLTANTLHLRAALTRRIELAMRRILKQ